MSPKELLKSHFMSLNRNLTFGLLAILVLCSAGLWSVGVVVQGGNSVAIGLVLIVLAIVFQKLPHITYLLIRKRDLDIIQQVDPTLANDWPGFKKWLEQTY